MLLDAIAVVIKIEVFADNTIFDFSVNVDVLDAVDTEIKSDKDPLADTVG